MYNFCFRGKLSHISVYLLGALSLFNSLHKTNFTHIYICILVERDIKLGSLTEKMRKSPNERHKKDSVTWRHLYCVLKYIRGHSLITLRVSTGEGLEKKLHTLTLRGGHAHSYVIFSKSIFYIRNRAVKWFGRDYISFASGR